MFELMGYSYQVIVTNIEDMSPEEVWRFYNRRANVENMIKDGTCHAVDELSAHLRIVMRCLQPVCVDKGLFFVKCSVAKIKSLKVPLYP
jgi:hypothetical protein